MARIVLYEAGKPVEYPNAHDVVISPGGVLVFYWETGSAANQQAYKVQTTVPYVVWEDVAVSS
jgi:hypothetical protein